MYTGPHVKYPLFLPHCVQTSSFSIDFRKILKYQISLKSVRWETSCYMWTDRQKKVWKRGGTIRKTDVTKLIVACRNFAHTPYYSTNNNNNQGTKPR